MSLSETACLPGEWSNPQLKVVLRSSCVATATSVSASFATLHVAMKIWLGLQFVVPCLLCLVACSQSFFADRSGSDREGFLDWTVQVTLIPVTLPPRLEQEGLSAWLVVWKPLCLDPSDGVFGRFDLAALCGCHTLNVCCCCNIR